MFKLLFILVDYLLFAGYLWFEKKYQAWSGFESPELILLLKFLQINTFR